MKKFLGLLAIVALIATTACGKKAGSGDNKADTSKKKTEEKK